MVGKQKCNIEIMRMNNKLRWQSLQWIIPVVIILGAIIILFSYNAPSDSTIREVLISFIVASAYAILAQIVPKTLQDRSDKNKFCECLVDYYNALKDKLFVADVYEIMDRYLTKIEFSIICFQFPDNKEIELFLELDKLRDLAKDLSFQRQSLALKLKDECLKIVIGYLPDKYKKRLGTLKAKAML